MLCGMMLSSLFGVVGCVGEVPVRDVRVVAALHMVPCFMMFRGFAMMLGRVVVVLGCFVMMRSAFVMVHCRQFSFGDRIGTWIRRVSGAPRVSGSWSCQCHPARGGLSSSRLMIHQTPLIIK